MPYRILCNGVQREGAKLSPTVASELFCYVPLHKIRYGVDDGRCTPAFGPGYRITRADTRPLPCWSAETPAGQAGPLPLPSPAAWAPHRGCALQAAGEVP